MNASSEAKSEVRRLIESSDLVFDEAAAGAALAGLPAKAVLRALQAGLCRARSSERHRAAALLGLAVAEQARQDEQGLEAARDLLRRLLWSLNEESGTMAWGAPEAMAEIMARHEGLAREFAHLLAAHVNPGLNPLDNPALLAGALWGLGRLAGAQPGLAQGLDLGAAILPHLASSSAALRGLAAWAVGQAGLREAGPALGALWGDHATLELPGTQGGRTASVAELAREALAELGAAGQETIP